VWWWSGGKRERESVCVCVEAHDGGASDCASRQLRFIVRSASDYTSRHSKMHSLCGWRGVGVAAGAVVAIAVLGDLLNLRFVFVVFNLLNLVIAVEKRQHECITCEWVVVGTGRALHARVYMT
jgi:anti-sigma-K factor RskA